MKYLVIVGLTFCMQTAFAQNDSLEFIHGLPVIEDDTVQQFPQEDLEPLSNYTRIAKNEIPPRLQRTLKHDDLYKGWENSPIYLDRNTGLYILHLSSATSVRTYRFNESGKPVSYSETAKPRDE
jgi:hypothetical protein